MSTIFDTVTAQFLAPLVINTPVLTINVVAGMVYSLNAFVQRTISSGGYVNAVVLFDGATPIGTFLGFIDGTPLTLTFARHTNVSGTYLIKPNSSDATSWAGQITADPLRGSFQA